MKKNSSNEKYLAKRGIKYRDISGDDLNLTLLRHQVWGETAHEEGTRADFTRANLEGANLKGANLYGANLQRARLRNVNLRGAKLQGANRKGAVNLTQEQLDGACGDEHTKLPDGLTIKRRSETKKNEKKGLEKRKNEP